MQDYTHKSIIVVRDDSSKLELIKHIGLTALKDEAENGAVLIWDYKGLFLLMCNAALRNYTRQRVYYNLTADEFTILKPTIAKLLLE